MPQGEDNVNVRTKCTYLHVFESLLVKAVRKMILYKSPDHSKAFESRTDKSREYDVHTFVQAPFDSFCHLKVSYM